MTPNPQFKVTPKSRWNIQTERNTHPTHGCHFEWPRVISSDLAKYSVARSIARPLCDSWATCFFYELTVFRCLLPWQHYGNLSSRSFTIDGQRFLCHDVKFARWQHSATAAGRDVLCLAPSVDWLIDWFIFSVYLEHVTNVRAKNTNRSNKIVTQRKTNSEPRNYLNFYDKGRNYNVIIQKVTFGTMFQTVIRGKWQ